MELAFKTPHPQPTISVSDCEGISELEMVQHDCGVVLFKNVIDIDEGLLLPYLDEEVQYPNCGLSYKEENGEKWAEDFEGKRHDIRLLEEQPMRLGGIAEHEPVMDRTPPEIVEIFNNLEDALYKCLIRYIDLYPLLLNTLWWKMRGHVLSYHQTALLGPHNDSDTNYRVIDGLRHESLREIAVYIVLNGIVSLSSDYEGGESHFIYANTSFKMEKGDMAFFPCNYVGSHEVTPVTAGKRYMYLSQFGHGHAPKQEIKEATESFEWLPPVYLPWIYQDYERFLKSGFARDHRIIDNPVLQDRPVEGPPQGVKQPYV